MSKYTRMKKAELIEELEKRDGDPTSEASDRALDKMIQALQAERLTTEELLAVLSHLIFTVGASIEGYKGTTPPPSEIRKLHLANPEKLGLALMQQGLEMRFIWTEGLQQVQKAQESQHDPYKPWS